ncbi:DUF6888 family protein [Synechocystis sp. PCC 7509]|uniref:DUF6888 family protein n=1 Tax=Synechocystis sp. PCC 7509 TaxID=927677 RepID=UPI003D767668
MPTDAQILTCFILCQRLTMMYRPLYLVCLDKPTGEVFILAGEEMQILIDRTGKWRFEL